MKLKVITLSILAAIGSESMAANVYDKDDTRLDVFGSVSSMFCTDKAARVLKTSSYKHNDDNTLHTAVDFGVAGSSRINDAVTAIAFTQWYAPTDSNGFDSFKTKAQYVGIDASNYGILTFGRGDNAFYTVTGVTDIYNQLDSYVHDHYAFGDYQQGLIMYSLSAMGMDFRASYQLAVDDVANSDVDITNGASFAIAAKLANKFSFAYGLSYYDLRSPTNGNGSSFYQGHMKRMYHISDNQKATSLCPSWKIDKGLALSYGDFGDGLYVAFNATVTKYDNYTNHLYAYELMGNYAFENGLSFSLGYGIKRFDGANVISDLTFGAYYKLIDNVNIFLEGCIDLNGKADRYFEYQEIKDECLNKNKALLGVQYSY